MGWDTTTDIPVNVYIEKYVLYMQMMVSVK